MSKEIVKQPASKMMQTDVTALPEPQAQVEKRGFFTEYADFAEYFKSAGKLKLTAQQKEILYAEFSDELVEIRTDGIVYLPFIFFSHRLHDAFGVGWAMIPVERPLVRNDDVICHYALIIDGIYIADAYGDAKYYPQNPQMSYADCLEGAKSDCLRRVCKAMGIGTKLWEPEYLRCWKEKYASKKWNVKRGKYDWFRKKKDEGSPQTQVEPEPAPQGVEAGPQLVDDAIVEADEEIKGKWREDTFKKITHQDFIEWCKKHHYPNIKDARGSLLLFTSHKDVSEITPDDVDHWVANVMRREAEEKGKGKT